MGEWSDFGVPGQDYPGSSEGMSGDLGMADTLDSGSGADPYTYDPTAQDPESGDGYADTNPLGGVLSGGLMGTGDSVYPGLVRSAGLTILGRPGGNALWQNTPDTLPSPGPYRQRSAGGQSSASMAGEIIRSVRASTGLRVTARGIVGMIVKYGFEAAAKLTGLAARELLFLFMRQKGVRHYRRGPGLYTIGRKLRAADRLRASCARILGRGGHSRRHRRAPYRHFKKRRR